MTGASRSIDADTKVSAISKEPVRRLQSKVLPKRAERQKARQGRLSIVRCKSRRHECDGAGQQAGTPSLLAKQKGPLDAARQGVIRMRAEVPAWGGMSHPTTGSATGVLRRFSRPQERIDKGAGSNGEAFPDAASTRI